MAVASALASPAGNSTPFTPSRRWSATPPAGDAITGRPLAIASSTTSPSVSVVEANTKASQLA